MEGNGLLISQNYQATSIQGRYSSLPLLVVGEQLCHCCGTGKDSSGLPLVHHPQIWGPRRVGEWWAQASHCWPESTLHGVPGTAESWTGLQRGLLWPVFLWRNRETAQIYHYTRFHPTEGFRLSFLPCKEGPKIHRGHSRHVLKDIHDTGSRLTHQYFSQN